MKNTSWKLKLFKFYFSKRVEGDKFFYWGRNFLGRYKCIKSEEYFSFYGYALHIGPLHFVIGSFMQQPEQSQADNGGRGE